MLTSLNAGVSGLQQFQQQLDVIGNNIANVNTYGYKSARAEFAETLSETQQNADGSANLQVGSGVTTTTIKNNYASGTAASTGQETDLAINGQGFFMVRDAVSGKEFATRVGSFSIDPSGYLVNSEGLRVQGYTDSALAQVGDIRIDISAAKAANISSANGALATATAAKTAAEAAATGSAATATTAAQAYQTAAVAAAANPSDNALATAATNAKDAADQAAAAAAASKALADAAAARVQTAQTNVAAAENANITRYAFDTDGKLKVQLSDNTIYTQGQVLLQNFLSPQGLVKEGGNLYSGWPNAGPLSTLAAPNTNGLGILHAGKLELSNVDLTNEFAGLIATQRAFQASARIVTTSDEFLQEVVNLIR